MRVPASTYRLQLGSELPLERVRSLVDYFAGLGVDYLYLSPVLAARPGSTHGYDVIDPARIDPDLGSLADLEALGRELGSRDMGLLLDVVPNHMAADADNPWWFDVLFAGRDSAYADFFDIDWSAGGPDLEDRVLLPILGDELAQTVGRGELRPVCEGGMLVIAYFERRLPMCAQSWPSVLEPALERADTDQLRAVVDRCRGLSALGPEERRGELGELRRQLESLLQVEAVRGAVEAELAAIGDEPTHPRLLSLLGEQHYRLRPWRGPLPLNYRRFFDVSGLVGLRVEDPRVFEESHTLIHRLISGGIVQGLRIDHPDGLLDPEGYLERLAQSVPDRGLFVAVEKILSSNERLRDSWPVAGTTGYEQLAMLGGVLLDAGGRAALLDTYVRFTGQSADFAHVARDSKRHVLRQLLAPEVRALVDSLSALLAPAGPSAHDIEEALSWVIACFGAYRSYVRPGSSRVEDEDRQLLERALAAARQQKVAPAALDAIRSALLLEPPVAHDEQSRQACLELLLCFQQLTGPAAAKGVEDTACYRYVPLAALDEVGGAPDRFGVSVEEFHAHNRERARHWPGSLSASSTHDTKRSEDVRCRIGVLSGVPASWNEAVGRWSTLAAPHRRSLPDGPVPSAHDEYLLYQTLVGTWPEGSLDDAALDRYRQRISAYMLKAAREAKLSTSWIDGNADYEAALGRFVDRLLDRGHSATFLDDLDRFVGPVALAGRLTSLSMLVLKLASPGVPDFYQGSELWTSGLVDPDNRRPVDFDLRRAQLGALTAEADAPALLATLADGRLKLLVTTRGLWLRRRHPQLFATGDYLPARAVGSRASQLVAFSRVHGDDAVVAAVGRFFERFEAEAPVGDAWGDTTLELPPALPEGRYRDVLVGSRAGSRIPATDIRLSCIRKAAVRPHGTHPMNPSPLSERASGVLLHPTSLPGPHGHGDLGPAAHRFAGFLASAGQTWWQMLPLGPPGACNSPYDSPSTFAGSAGLVSLEQLAADGLLEPSEITPSRGLQGKRARFTEASHYRLPRLKKAHERFTRSKSKTRAAAFEAFREENQGWLGDYALYRALKSAEGGKPWYEWAPELTARRSGSAAPRGQAAGRRGLVPRIRAIRVRPAMARPAQALPGARHPPAGRRTHLRRARRRRRVGTSRDIPCGSLRKPPRRSGRAARRVQLHRPAVGESTVPVVGAGTQRLRLVDRATARHALALRRRAPRSLHRLPPLLGSEGRVAHRRARSFRAGAGRALPRRSPRRTGRTTVRGGRSRHCHRRGARAARSVRAPRHARRTVCVRRGHAERLPAPPLFPSRGRLHGYPRQRYCGRLVPGAGASR